MATIVHFDLPAEDLERAAPFYGKLLGWKFERMPGPMEYFGITTFDDQGRPSLGGGMGKKERNGTPGIPTYIGARLRRGHPETPGRAGGQGRASRTVVGSSAIWRSAWTRMGTSSGCGRTSPIPGSDKFRANYLTPQNHILSLSGQDGSSMCDYRYRDSFCANGKVPSMRCVGDGECPLRDRSSSTFKESAIGTAIMTWPIRGVGK
jgi:hypothetical protein